jgi:hypothetical protein
MHGFINLKFYDAAFFLGIMLTSLFLLLLPKLIQFLQVEEYCHEKEEQTCAQYCTYRDLRSDKFDLEKVE